MASVKSKTWHDYHEKALSKYKNLPTCCPFGSVCDVFKMSLEHIQEWRQTDKERKGSISNLCPEIHKDIIETGEYERLFGPAHYMECELYSEMKFFWEFNKNKVKARAPISPKIRFHILNRDKYSCTYCGVKASETRLHIDHIIPVSAGGANDPGNLTTSCEQCNFGKGGKLLNEVDHV
jgi:hypothetical protein